MASQPQLSDLTQQMLAGTGMDIKDMQRNALAKQYDVTLQLKITEAKNGAAFYDSGPMTWYSAPYPFAVVMERTLVEVLDKLTVVGSEIATGGEFTPPA